MSTHSPLGTVTSSVLVRFADITDEEDEEDEDDEEDDEEEEDDEDDDDSSLLLSWCRFFEPMKPR